jgi:hypothetical protein
MQLMDNARPSNCTNKNRSPTRLPMLVVLFLSLAQPLHAQSLEIGGIAVRLGEDFSSVASRFRPLYDVDYFETFWFVAKHVAPVPVPVGQLWVKENKVVGIAKGHYDVRDELMMDVYTTAYREIQQLGGKACQTSNVEWPDGSIQGISTSCGRYELVFRFPQKGSRPGTVYMGANIAIYLGEVK